jgi:hypothetical protein
MGLSVMNMLGLSPSVRIAHTARHRQFFLYQCRLSKADQAFSELLLRQQLNHLKSRKLDRRQNLSPYIFELVKVRVTIRLAVYLQSVPLGVKPLET